MVWRISPLLQFKMLGVFNIFTSDDKLWQFVAPYSEAIILKNEKLILNFLLYFGNFLHILNIFQKKKIVIAYVLPKLQTVKDLVRALSKNQILSNFFESQRVKGSQTLLMSSWENFYHIFSSLWE